MAESGTDTEVLSAGSLKSLSDKDVVKLSTLAVVSRILNSSHQWEEALESVLSTLMSALGASRGMLQLFHPELRVARDASTEPAGGTFAFSQTLLETSLADLSPLLRLDAASETASRSAIHTGIRSVMIQPILCQGRAIGVAYLDSLVKVGVFGENELKLLGIVADMVAGFVARTGNAEALEQKTVELQAANELLMLAAEETIFKLSRAAEFRDDEGGEHVQRVSLYCEAMALQLGASPAEAAAYRVASQLHDVGKVGLPDAILLKTGRYTDHEREVMKQHTIIGSKILAGSKSEVIQLAEEMALTHHERWDGSGYPRGLAGNKIPLSGRLVAVADVFDALVTERRYKKAWTTDRAFQLIRENAGTHFDPAVAGVFLEIADQILEIRQTHQTELPEVTTAVTPTGATRVDGLGWLRPVQQTVELLSRGVEVPQGLLLEALDAARKLIGLMPTLGLEMGPARRLEAYIQRRDLHQDHAPRLAELLAEVEKGLTCAEEIGAPLLLVDPDPLIRESLVIEASHRGVPTVEADSVDAAQRSMSTRRPQAVVIEAAMPGAEDFLDWLALGHPDTPVVVLSSESGYARRSAAARRGPCLYLDKPVSAGAVLDEIDEQLVPPADVPRVVRVALNLEPTPALDRLGFEISDVAGLEDLCSPLGRSAPDLYLLEMDFRDAAGLEVCRVLRADPRRASVPLVVTTSNVEEETYRAALEAGADDVLPHPIAPARLAARLRSLLRRNRVVRASAQRDRITGLLDPVVARRTMHQLLSLAARNNVPFTLCHLRVEGLEEETAARALCQVGHLLERQARSADILTRQDDSFLLALYGSGADAVERRRESVNAALTEILKDGGSARCWARVATYPQDGTRLGALLSKISA